MLNCSFNEAKEQILNRRDKLKEKFLNQNLKIYTFDAFFSSILRAFALNLGLSSNFSVDDSITSIQNEKFLSEISKNEQTLKNFVRYIFERERSDTQVYDDLDKFWKNNISLKKTTGAKIFNLKQAAKTLSYLMENKLTDYETLEEKAKQLVSDFNTISAQMKQAEKRMQDISDLKKHIYQYAKTKEVYVAYRKAGYSKKFYAENEEKIRLHKAAKVAFSALNTEKLPTIKELSKEYEKLLTEKKNLYSDYRKKKKEMQEILTVKSNVDRLLFPPQKEQPERENER